MFQSTSSKDKGVPTFRGVWCACRSGHESSGEHPPRAIGEVTHIQPPTWLSIALHLLRRPEAGRETLFGLGLREEESRRLVSSSQLQPRQLTGLCPVRALQLRLCSGNLAPFLAKCIFSRSLCTQTHRHRNLFCMLFQGLRESRWTFSRSSGGLTAVCI